MNLFGHEKDLIHRLTNLVFVLWFVIALFIAYSSLIDMIVKKEMLTYNEYQKQYCVNNLIRNDEKTSDDTDSITYKEGDCKASYDRYTVTFDDEAYYNRRSLFNSLGNIVIVSATLFILNRKKIK